MFEHPTIRHYKFDEIPLNQDIYIVDEKWITEYDANLVSALNGGKYFYVGYVSYVAARAIYPSTIELSWYPNVHDRFHEVRILLPKNQFVICVDCYELDEKPRIFVKSEWLRELHLKQYATFAMVDAIGVKRALREGVLSRDRLTKLRTCLDEIAEKFPNFIFVSFADSVLIKSNWTVGMVGTKIKYTYEPESILQILPDLRAAYREILELDSYAIVTQGVNEFDEIQHISSSRNHTSLNCLGLPFAQLMSIDKAVRDSIRQGLHSPAELYLDEDFYHSLRFRMSFDKDSIPKFRYRDPMMSGLSSYFGLPFQVMLGSLEKNRTS